MDEVSFALPADIVEALRVPPAEQQVRLRHELALRLYQKNLLSFGKARELAGLDKWGFYRLLAEEEIVRHYDEEELAWDLTVLENVD